MLLSIGIMVKNEEKYLDKCLSSLMPILNNIDSELIVVDTGSTDRTVEIAKKYTDKVYFHKWNNNFSEIRNVSISYCSGEWFFYIDGDEIIENCDGIIDFFKSQDYKSYNSATIYIKNIADLSDEAKYSVFSALRLFKKDSDFKFVNAVHNQPIYKIPIKVLEVNCRHYGYVSNDKELMERKFKRTAAILKNELKKNPENIYYLSQLSVSYGMHKEYDMAVKYIQMAYDCMKKKNVNHSKYMYVYTQLCMSYFNIDDYINTEKYAKEALTYDQGLIDIYYYLGATQMILKKNDEAVTAFEIYLKIYKNYYKVENNLSVIDYTLGKVNEVYYILYMLKKEAKDYISAEKYLLCITDDKHHIPQNIVSLCIASGDYEKIKKYEKKLLDEGNKEDIRNLYIAIEEKKLKLDFQDSKKLTQMFSTGNMAYNFLNSIRLKYENEKIADVDTLKQFFQKFDISSEPLYFADLIYYMICSKEDISKITYSMSFEKINEFFDYLIKKYENLSEYIYEYILKYEYNDDFNSIKINKELCRYVIILDKLEKDKLEHIYERYIQIGIDYMKYVYSSFILENEFWQNVRTPEEEFFIFMYKAKQCESYDKKLYLRYLRAALDFYPYMKKLIEYLLNKERQNSSEENSEFKSYKAQVKSTIKSLIENEKFDSAKAVIDEYEKIVPNDMEIVLFKSQISLRKLKSQSSNCNVKYKM